MTKLLHYLTRCIVPVFLLQTLSLQAETTTVSCDSLFTPPVLSEQTTGVQQRLNQYKTLVNGRQCIVLDANPEKDLSELIKQIPENTVILLSSETATPVNTPSNNATSTPPIQSACPAASDASSVTPEPCKIPVEYLIGSTMLLKNGQDILGAADEGFDIVIRDQPGFAGKHMIKVGNTDSFQSKKRKDSHIKHLTFRPTRDNNRLSIESAVFAACYNRNLIVEENVFHLPAQAAVTLDCRQPLKATDARPGPGLQFADNTLIGESYIIEGKQIYSDYIPDFNPDQGVLINLPAINNQSGKLTVTGNTFQGRMAQAAEFRLGAGTSIDIFSNTIDITSIGHERNSDASAGGFVLVGITDRRAERPVFHLVNNQIRATVTAITVKDQLGLTLACNHLETFQPWYQPINFDHVKTSPEWWLPLQRFSVKALPISDKDVAKLCEKPVGATADMPLPTPPVSSQFVNTWTFKYIPINACSDLYNLEGQLFFDKEVCQPVAPPSIFDSVEASSASAGSAKEAFALCILITLPVLAALIQNEPIAYLMMLATAAGLSYGFL